MKKLIPVLFLILSVNIFAQDKTEFTGVLSLDSQIAASLLKIETEGQLQGSLENAKSPLLAGFLSLIVPGAGEFYAESYLKSIIFVVVEAAVISTSVIYEGKGDDQTAFFENFAHGHWDAARYAKWTITNLETINPSLNPDDYSGLFLDPGRTQVNWGVLNQLENDIGGYYSHRLAPFGDQQYYEMIGKYPQFNPGWDDFGDEFTPFQFGDEVTPNFRYYSGERGKANDYYNIASKAVVVAVINHVISAVDAAWTTSRYNKNLKMKMELEKTNIGYSTEYYPSLHIQYRF